jgi:paraquat-inducible protein B
MGKKTNPTVIGGFVVTALVLAVAGVLVFGSGKFFTTTKRFVMFFEGSVKGLNIGAPVVFRGVKIGAVSDIQLYFNPKDNKFQIPVFVEIEPDRIHLVSGAATETLQGRAPELFREGLRAQLEMQSIVTGQLMIDVDFHPGAPLNMVGAIKGVDEFPTIPTAIQQLQAKLQSLPLGEIIQSVSGSLEGIDRMLNSEQAKEGFSALTETLKETQNLMTKLDARVDPLADSIEGTMKDARSLLQNVDSQVAPLAEGLEGTLGDTRKLLRSTDERLGQVTGSTQDTMRDAQKLVRDVDVRMNSLLEGVGGTKEALDATLRQATTTLATLQEMTADDSPLRFETTNALRDLAAAARSIRFLADFLEKHPDALLRGKGEAGGK